MNKQDKIFAAETQAIGDFNFGEKTAGVFDDMLWWPLEWITASTNGMHFNWKRVLIKEYNTMFVLIAALIGLELWTECRIAGPSALPSKASMVTGVVLWPGFYVAVRTRKKSGYVRG